jgi:hypothetical protein
VICLLSSFYPSCVRVIEMLSKPQAGLQHCPWETRRQRKTQVDSASCDVSTYKVSGTHEAMEHGCRLVYLLRLSDAVVSDEVR